SEPNEEGMRTISFELNGQRRSITVYDKAIASTTEENRKAETDYEIGAPLQGRISSILVEVDAEVKQNDPLFVIEAMKMETTVSAPFDGIISRIHLSEGAMVKQQDLVVEFVND
ncbi:MAG: biotin/lipoyl-containing protein, partial [Pseudomonadota bacterium]